MEALDFVKLHSLYAHFSSIIETTFPLFTSDFYGEEDSFFDLDFISASPENDLLLSQPETVSKRKILPIELSSKPESPADSVSGHKSAPRLSISLFKRPKLMAKRKTEETESPAGKPQSTESKRFAFKLTRINSFRNSPRKEPSDRPAKRFSGEGVRKYLKLIKPLYVKVSKRNSFTAAPESSPAAATSVYEKQKNIPVGIRVVCRRLGKCKSSSSSAAAAAVSAANRRDDSLLQQDDGIEGAILHCKRSFNGCRDASLLEDELQKQKAGKDVHTEAEEEEEP